MNSHTIDRPTADDALVLGTLRHAITGIDNELLELLTRRMAVARDVGLAKRLSGRAFFDADRESDSRQALAAKALEKGLSERLVIELHNLLCRHSLAEQMHKPKQNEPRITPPNSEGYRLTRWEAGRETTVDVRGTVIGEGFTVIAGPCAVENAEMINQAADTCRALGVGVMRGGAFKPRTSPYDFQGHGLAALEWLASAAHTRGMGIVTEVLEPADVETVAEQADMLQIGARNMQNFALLRAVGKTNRPVLLKRGAGATVKEWLCAAEYILLEGNKNVVLCERGSKGFEGDTRNTLDLQAALLAKQWSHLPVIIDPSHSSGRPELVGPLCCAAKAAGLDGVIVEMHPCKEEALCDREQALRPSDLAEIVSVLS